MARYIDADALLGNLPDDLPYKASVKRVLMQAPTVDFSGPYALLQQQKAEIERLKKKIEEQDEDIERLANRANPW